MFDTTLFSRPLRAACGLFLISGLGACANLDAMVANFETRWEDPAAVLDGDVALTPEAAAEAAQQAELDERQLLAQFEQAIFAGDCERVRTLSYSVGAIDGQALEADIALADCDLQTRDLASARQRFQAIRERSEDARSIRGLGLIALLDGQDQLARDHLNLAKDMMPDDWRTWNGLGFAEDGLQNWGAAEQAYKQAHLLSPKAAAPLNNLGMSYIQQARYTEAAAVLRQALALDNSSDITRLNLRITMGLGGDLGRALAGAKDDERAIILNMVGASALADGDPEQAKILFAKALEASPRFYPKAYENLERLLLAETADDF